MKIIHTADWHLGNTFHGYDRADEHRAFLDHLLHTLRTEEADALVVAGDVFDNPNPSAAAEEMFYDFLDRAAHENEGLQIVVIAGNHDSAARLEAPGALLRRRGVEVRGLLERTPDGQPDYDRLLLPLHSRQNPDERVLCLAVPYLRPSDLESGVPYAEGVRRFMSCLLHRADARKDFRSLPRVAVAHFYATGADIAASEHSERLVVGGQDCVDASVLATGMSYVALGHIHKQQRVGGRDNVRYSGSALPLSFGERGYTHGVTVADIDPSVGQTEVRLVSYEPLRRLISIPTTGALPAAEALAEIASLPRAAKDDDGRTWPYLELKISEDEPDASLPHRLAEALEGRAVHFCRIERVTRATDAGEQQPVFSSLEKLKSLTPLEMVRMVYEKKYDGASLPPAWEALFHEAEKNLSDEA